MNNLILILIIVAVVVFFMYRNINKITANIDTIDNKSFEIYAKYVRIIEKYIKEIQENIDKNSVLNDEKYILTNQDKKDDISDKLFDIIRNLAFFETVQAKKKDKKEIESQLFDILISLDGIIKENFKNGESLADELRENLKKEYQKLKDGYLKN